MNILKKWWQIYDILFFFYNAGCSVPENSCRCNDLKTSWFCKKYILHETCFLSRFYFVHTCYARRFAAWGPYVLCMFLRKFWMKSLYEHTPVFWFYGISVITKALHNFVQYNIICSSLQWIHHTTFITNWNTLPYLV